MAAKLTLQLDEVLIARAKAYARARGTSLSQVTADLFAALIALEAGFEERQARSGLADQDDWMAELAPRVRALLQRPDPNGVSEPDVVLGRDVYRRFLAEKHD
ncbi:MAG: DUF6364 family protein [Bacteroidota bacterium]